MTCFTGQSFKLGGAPKSAVQASSSSPVAFPAFGREFEEVVWSPSETGKFEVWSRQLSLPSPATLSCVWVGCGDFLAASSHCRLLTGHGQDASTHPASNWTKAMTGRLCPETTFAWLQCHQSFCQQPSVFSRLEPEHDDFLGNELAWEVGRVLRPLLAK